MANLSFVNVTKTYKNGFCAVKDFTLEIRDKEFIIFVGPSGCGKSTTLRMVAGFIGSPAMNFLDAWVERRNGSIYLEFYRQQLLMNNRCAKRLIEGGYVGKRVTLGIRPEDLHLEGEESRKLFFTVELTEMLGAESFVYGLVGREQVCARLKPDIKVTDGQTLPLYLDMDRIKLFDIETEENILYV